MEELLAFLAEHSKVMNQKGLPEQFRLFDGNKDAAEAVFSFGDYKVKAEANDRAMTCKCVISTEDRDRSRDVMKLGGMELKNHQSNPIVLLEHIRVRPVGIAQDPLGAYTVKREGNRLTAVTHFNQGDLLAEQSYDLISKGMFRGASIGFRASYQDVKRIPDDPSEPYGPATFEIGKSELIEYSHVLIPDNADCLVQAWTKGAAGKPLIDALKSRIKPQYDQLMDTRKTFWNGWTPPSPTEEEKKKGVTERVVEKTVVKTAKPVMPVYEGPAGAQGLAKAFDMVVATSEALLVARLETECPVVKSELARLADETDKRLQDISGLYHRQYPHLKALAPEGATEIAGVLVIQKDFGTKDGQDEAFKALAERVGKVREFQLLKAGKGPRAALRKALGMCDLIQKADGAPDELKEQAREVAAELAAQTDDGADAKKDGETQKAINDALAKVNEQNKTIDRLNGMLVKLMHGRSPTRIGAEADGYDPGPSNN